MIYLWSDTHFNHGAIIEHSHRPFRSLDAMNETLIERWNSTVKPTDTIWHLGDFAFKPRLKLVGGDMVVNGVDLSSLFSKLNGHKCLVVGNHDEKNPAVLKLPWERIERLHVLKDSGARAVLCHYPIESWYGAHRGVLMFHGHCHGSLRHKLGRRFDVGADVRAHPVSFAQLIAEAALEDFEPVDHHVPGGEDL